ncbi:hypothetical protein ACWA7J_07370 [Leptothrix sp. BB-4]
MQTLHLRGSAKFTGTASPVTGALDVPCSITVDGAASTVACVTEFTVSTGTTESGVYAGVLAVDLAPLAAGAHTICVTLHPEKWASTWSGINHASNCATVTVAP